MGKTLVGFLSACAMFAGGFAWTAIMLPAPAHAERTQDEKDQVGAQIESLRQQLVKNQYVAAAAIVERMASDSPQTLSVVPLQWVYIIVRSLKDAGHTKEHGELLSVLASPDYKPLEGFGSNDGFRAQYADVLFSNGNVERAGKIISSLESPDLLAQSSLDPRYREFFTSDPDVRAAAEKRLALHKKMAEQIPEMLGAVISAAADLRKLGRPQEAVDLLRSIEPRLDKKDAFFDRGTKLNWWWDELGRSYTALGKYDEAVASFRKGIAASELGSPNVSQLINLAETQNAFGKGEDALATLATFGKRGASEYGLAEMHFARGCALAVAGRGKDGAEDLAFVKAHEKAHPEALRDLLLCMGDLDGAAAVFIRHVEDLELRADVMMQLSDYDEPPATAPKDPIFSRLPVLKARPDVQAAIAQAGGVRRFRMQRPGL